MKRLVAGLSCFLAGVTLCGINWLGAAAASPAVTEWDGTRMNGAWKLVGHGPLVFGIILLVLGLVLVVSSVISATQVDAP
jgi:hypothetical protein